MTQTPLLDIGPIRHRLALPARSFESHSDAHRLVTRHVTGPAQRRAQMLMIGAMVISVIFGMIMLRFLKIHIDGLVWSEAVSWAYPFSGMAFSWFVLIIVFIVLLIVGLVMRRAIVLAMRASYKASDSPPHELVIGEDGVAIQDAACLTVALWPAVSGLIRGKGQWILVLRSLMFLTIPDEILGPAPGKDELLAFIRSKAENIR